MNPLTRNQLDVLEFLRKQDQPFAYAQLWGWGVPTQTVNMLARRGHIRPVAGGWTTTPVKKEGADEETKTKGQ